MVTEAVSEIGVKASLPCKYLPCFDKAITDHWCVVTAIVSVPVSDGVQVNCALIGDPVFSSSYLFTDHNVMPLLYMYI